MSRVARAGLAFGRSHQNLLDVMAWINIDLAATLKAHSPLPAVLDKGAGGFRAQAEAIIKS